MIHSLPTRLSRHGVALAALAVAAAVMLGHAQGQSASPSATQTQVVRPNASQRGTAAPKLAVTGITHRRLSFRGAGGGQVPVDLFTVDPALAAVEVVSMRAVVRSDPSSAGLGLTEMAKRLTGTGRQRAVLVLSGGNIPTVPHTPMGGLVVNGREVSPFDHRLSVAPKQNNADKALSEECRTKTEAVGRRLGGVLCVNGPKVAIRLSRDVESAPYVQCRHAIQSLPVVVHPADGSNGICSAELFPTSTASPVERSVACVTPDGRVHFAVTGPTLLYPLADWLRSPAGPGCRGALNLVGDNFAAARFMPGGNAEPISVGNAFVAQASLIVVRGR